MAQHDFRPLQQQFPEVIGAMPSLFNAHDFILELARRNQRLYVEALYTYCLGNPFQTVHQQIAMLLNESPLVRRDGNDSNGRDIFNQPQGCSRWRRV
jgi:hypothetical protein